MDNALILIVCASMTAGLLGACSDPQCGPGQTKIGTVCHPNPSAKADASAEESDDANSGAREADASEERPFNGGRDSGISGAAGDEVTGSNANSSMREMVDAAAPAADSSMPTTRDGAEAPFAETSMPSPADSGMRECTADVECHSQGNCELPHCSVQGRCEAVPTTNHSDCQLPSSNGVCSDGGCVGCIDSSDCERLTPDKAICNGGTCVACNVDKDCSAVLDSCHEPACTNHLCTSRVKPWVSCGAGKVCDATTGSCDTACGNGHVDDGEDCDYAAPGWDKWSCDSQTCRKTGLSGTTSYHSCASASACSVSETCKPTAALYGAPLCLPTCLNGRCPMPPGYTVKLLSTDNYCNSMSADCFVGCAIDGDCPPGLICAGGVCRAESL